MATYTYIASATVGSGGAMTIDFNSIPQTYTDLVLLVTSRNNANNYGGMFLKLNGSTWLSDVDALRLEGNGTSPASTNSEEMTWVESTYTAGAFANGQMYFPNYTSSTNKSVSFEGVSARMGSRMIHLSSWIWNQTAAITRIEIGNFDGLFPTNYFVQNSTAYLYGISNA